jgi:hypothetical protein
MQKLRNLALGFLVVVMLAVVPAAYAAMAVQWDPYSDPYADKLVIQSSENQTTWSTVTDNISTSDTYAAIPTYGTNNIMVYYRLIAVDTDKQSNDPGYFASSNVINYYWTTGGGGQITISPPGGFGFIDCSNPADGSEQGICSELGLQ